MPSGLGALRNRRLIFCTGSDRRGSAGLRLFACNGKAAAERNGEGRHARGEEKTGKAATDNQGLDRIGIASSGGAVEVLDLGSIG